jgi:anti-sigma factor RsiW
MNCREAIDLMGEFLEAALTPELAAELEAHLRDCPPCQAYLATYRKTREVTGRAERVPMPEEMQRRLREFLISRLGRK